MKLKDRVAVITGGGSGIGEATALRFAQEGAKLVLGDVNLDGARAVEDGVKKAGGQAMAIKVNVVDREEVKNLIETAVNTFGRIDILINNAGIFRDAMSWKMTEDQWDFVVDVNLKGTFNCCQFAIPYMRQQNYGKIVNTSSIGALGNPGQANYSAAKAGIMALTKTLALELARSNINVNCVAPGSIDTPILKGMPPDILKQVVEAKVPLRRMGTPAEVASLHTFLVSDEAAYITGQVIFIDGGASVGV